MYISVMLFQYFNNSNTYLNADLIFQPFNEKKTNLKIGLFTKDSSTSSNAAVCSSWQLCADNPPRRCCYRQQNLDTL